MSETTEEYSDPQDFHYEESMVNPPTPPTPDRAAVREALLAVLNCVEDEPEAYEACERLCAALQVSRDDGFDGIADALLAAVSRPAEARGEREAWIDGAAWASMENDEISVADIEAAADEKFGPEAVPSDGQRLDWLVSQTKPNHGVILCALDLPNEKWASVQRVNQFHNPHKVEWCIEGPTLRVAIDNAMALVSKLALSADAPERNRSLIRPAPSGGEADE